MVAGLTTLHGLIVNQRAHVQMDKRLGAGNAMTLLPNGMGHCVLVRVSKKRTVYQMVVRSMEHGRTGALGQNVTVTVKKEQDIDLVNSLFMEENYA